jgi:calcineurin-like phosphoesterase
VFIKYKVSNPFLRVQEILEMYKSETFDAIIIDFHKETTAE